MPDYKELKDALYKNLYKPAKKGFKNSNIGLAAGLAFGFEPAQPVEPEPPAQQFGNLASIASEMLSGTVEAAFDSPFYAMGGLATAAAAPPMAPIGAVAFNSLIKNAYKNAYRQEGKAKFGGLIDILKDTGYDAAIPAGLGIGAKAAPIVYKATLKPIVNEAGRQVVDKMAEFIRQLNVLRNINNLKIIEDEGKNIVYGALPTDYRQVGEKVRASLTKAKNGKPYIKNTNDNFIYDVPRKFSGEIKGSLTGNGYEFSDNKRVLENIENIFRESSLFRKHKDINERVGIKGVRRHAGAFRVPGRNEVFPIKFTSREYDTAEKILRKKQTPSVRPSLFTGQADKSPRHVTEGVIKNILNLPKEVNNYFNNKYVTNPRKNLISEEILKNNKGRDFELYDMSIGNKIAIKPEDKTVKLIEVLKNLPRDKGSKSNYGTLDLIKVLTNNILKKWE